MNSIGQLTMRWRSAPKLVRRTRPIGTHQSAFGRFINLRQPWNNLEGMLTAKYMNRIKRRSVRPWPVWRCRLEKR